ncbi:hypothetical protein CesoFtcFv8_000328 [Champsocephalus esox]|uniref:Uncharacterized protein n=1 Tax=Champsocephalus esox TaxID=159716 RepID=A0AAN8DSU1_9TELE|nr:hypothetical protein CesoFtcFv8_000328 [Champsocephalus esox]
MTGPPWGRTPPSPRGPHSSPPLPPAPPRGGGGPLLPALPTWAAGVRPALPRRGGLGPGWLQPRRLLRRAPPGGPPPSRAPPTRGGRQGLGGRGSIYGPAAGPSTGGPRAPGPLTCGLSVSPNSPHRLGPHSHRATSPSPPPPHHHPLGAGLAGPLGTGTSRAGGRGGATPWGVAPAGGWGPRWGVEQGQWSAWSAR